MDYKGISISKVTKAFPGGIKVSGYEAAINGRRYFCQDAELCRRIIDMKEKPCSISR